MFNPTHLVERVHALGEAVIESGHFQGSSFRAALCDLIRQIPDEWECESHRLCTTQMCPPADRIISALQHDLDENPDDPDRIILLHPMIRVALSIRSGEIETVDLRPRY